MARPFMMIGSAMFVSLYFLTCFSVNHLFIILSISAVLTVLFLFVSIRFRLLKPIFLIFLGITLACSSYTFKTTREFIPATSYTTDKQVLVSGKVIENYKHNDYSYITLDNFQINNEKATKNKIQIRHRGYSDAEIDDILVVSAGSIAQYNQISAFETPDSDGVYIYANSNNIKAHIKAEKHSVRYYLENFRLYISETLLRYLDNEYAGAVNAMLTGDKSLLTGDTQQIFSYSGISHLFAVSGFHLSLWTSIIFLFTEHLKGKIKIIGNIFALCFVLFFMALTGFTPSVVRAGFMMIILIMGKLIKYIADSLNSLFVALTIILLINPYSVTSISLQMSFLATLGIVTFINPISEPVLNLKNKVKPKFLFKAINALYTTSVLSLIATIFTSPVSALNFGYYSFVAPITNLLCIPVAQLILPLSSIGLATSFIPFVTKIPFTMCNYIMKYVLFIADKMSSFEHATVNAKTDTVKILLFLILTVTIILICVFNDKNKHLRRTAFFMSLCFIALSVGVFSVEKQSVSIFVPDVKNGSSVICNIYGKKIIIGCGGNKYMEYSFTDTADFVSYKNYDLLIIPCNTDTESLYAKNLTQNKNFDCIIACKTELDYYTEHNISDSAIRTDSANIMIDENIKLVYIETESFHAAKLETTDFSCTVLFHPSSDLSLVPESWSNGNLLITRHHIPDENINFDDIIVSTDTDAINAVNNIKTTNKNGNIMYQFTPLTGAKTYADK